MAKRRKRRRSSNRKRSRDRSDRTDADERDLERRRPGIKKATVPPAAKARTPPANHPSPMEQPTPRASDRPMESRGYGAEAQYHIHRATKETGTDPNAVPDPVLDVLATGGGQSLDSSIRGALEQRMDADFSNVQIHTGPEAANAADAIGARAFTCGNAIVFNSGEYDPGSPEGQHLLAHELAHVKQQTGASISMLPQDGALQIDPDPQLEREAEKTATRVLNGDELGVQPLAETNVHVQRVPKDQMFSALAVFELENEGGEVGDFQQDQNARRAGQMREWIAEFNEQSNEIATLQNEHAAWDLLEAEIADTDVEVTDDGQINGPKEVTDDYLDHERAKEVLQRDLPSKSELEQRKTELENDLADKLSQVALTEEQRDKLEVGVERGFVGKIGEKTAFGLLKQIDKTFAVVSGAYSVVKDNWGTIDGDIVERAMRLREELLDEAVEEWTPDRTDKVNF